VGLVFNPSGKLALGVSIDDQNNVTIDITDMDGKLLNAITYSESSSKIDAAQLGKNVKQAFASAKLDIGRLCAAGMAVPGPIGSNGNDKYGEVADALEKLLRRTISVETLVDMAAVAESRAGNLKSDRLVLFIRTSHRLRSTLLLSENLISRHQHSGGEAGHIIAPWIREKCSCGKVGCANAHIGSVQIMQRAAELGAKAGNIGELIEQCSSGEMAAATAIADAGRATGFAIANLINVLAPVTVIISGRLNEAGDGFFGPLLSTCETYATAENFQSSTVLPSTLGSDSAAIGAALFALSRSEDLITFSDEVAK
jgi:predicted NBD/HSP70 family sugar kinase